MRSEWPSCPGSSTATITRPAISCCTRCWLAIPMEVEFVTIASIIDKLRVKAQKTAADTWVEGYFFDDTKVKDKRALYEQTLDRSVHATRRAAWCSIAADTPPSTTARRCKWRVSRRTRRIPRAALSIGTRTATSTGRVTDRAREVFSAVGKHMTYASARKPCAAIGMGLPLFPSEFVPPTAHLMSAKRLVMVQGIAAGTRRWRAAPSGKI